MEIISKTFWISTFILFATFALGQNENQRKITGIVYEAGEGPLIGASVFIKESGQGTVTDIEGKFELNIPEDKQVQITISYGHVSKVFKTKRGKSYYKINTRPLFKASILIGPGGVFLNQNEDSKGKSLSFLIGSKLKTSIYYNWHISSGIRYKFIQHNNLITNLHSIEMPFLIEYETSIPFYFSGGLKLNYILNRNIDNILPEDFYTMLHVGIGYQTYRKIHFELDLNYSLNDFINDTRLIRYGVNIIYPLN